MAETEGISVLLSALDIGLVRWLCMFAKSELEGRDGWEEKIHEINNLANTLTLSLQRARLKK